MLIGLPRADENFYMSSRNIPRTLVRPLPQLNAYEVIKQRRLLLTKEALDALKGGLKPLLAKAAEEAKLKAAFEGGQISDLNTLTGEYFTVADQAEWEALQKAWMTDRLLGRSCDH